MKLINLKGNKVGKWLVIKRHPENYRQTFAQWVCQCDCGTKRIVLANALLTGRSTSCGCVRIERLIKRQTIHGHASRNGETVTYRIWKHIHQRCGNPRCKDYRYYGGRGISVCKRWNEYKNFLADMGESPAGLTIDRINNDGNYTRKNCRWASRAVQTANRRVSLL